MNVFRDQEKLLVFGDSWPAGGELKQPDTECFPYVIAQQLGLKLKNYACGGTSTEQAVQRLLNDVNDWDNSIVLFCLTGISRSMIIENKQPIELHPLVSTPAADAYYKYIQSNELDEFNRLRNVLAAQQFCLQKKTKCLFVSNWNPLPRHPAIDLTNFYPKTLGEILNLDKNSERAFWATGELNSDYVKPNNGHPNVLGHQKIAEELSIWIKEKINDKSVS
jgi:hypothetical protein